MITLYRAPFSTNVERVALAILRHLEERYREPALFPDDLARRAELDVFLDWFEREWKLAPNAIEEELEGASPDPERIAGSSASSPCSNHRTSHIGPTRFTCWSRTASSRGASATPPGRVEIGLEL